MSVITLWPVLYLAVAGTIFGVRDSRWAFWLSIAVFWGGMVIPRAIEPRDEASEVAIGIACITLLIASGMGMLARASFLASPPLPPWGAMALGLGVLLAPPAWLCGLIVLR